MRPSISPALVNSARREQKYELRIIVTLNVMAAKKNRNLTVLILI